MPELITEKLHMRHKSLKVGLLLAFTYFIFAILLNSVGTVILQVINNYDVLKTDASQLEAFKDLPIAIISFLAASALPRFGLRRAMMVGMAIIALTCAVTPLFPAFWMTKLMFLCTGVAFALVKVSVYASIGLMTNGSREHAGMLNIIEGLYMVGVLAGYWLFSAFIDADDPKSTEWLVVYWYIAGLCVINILLWLVTPMDESELEVSEGKSRMEEFIDMVQLVKLPLVYVFVISVFLYVLVEQGVGTWLPTFNNKILQLPPDMSVQATSIFAACLAVGRLSAGMIMQHVNWYVVLNACLLIMVGLILITMPMTENISHDTDVTWLNVSPAAYVFPLIGLFMAPIYPAINSVILSTLPKRQHASMTGLIVIFSALGGTTGSILIGIAFDALDGQTAFYLSIIPISGVMIALFALRKLVNKRRAVKIVD